MKEISVDGQRLQKILPPHPQLPKLAPPRDRLVSSDEPPQKLAVEMMNLIRQSGNAISKRLSFQSEKGDGSTADSGVTEFEISGVKVLVKLKTEEEIRGRITFFSRSNCRDSTAVRLFLRERGFNFSEINVDVYTEREAELIERTGDAQVPKIFFNEKHFGGLMALNALRNSGEFDRRIKDFLSEKCGGDAPSPAMYGFDEESSNKNVVEDEMMRFVKVLRQKLPIKDRLMKMKIVKNCFSGAEMVEILIDHLDCGRKKAVEVGKRLARKHFIHHVFGENEFEDGNHYYRLLEHEPYISKCYNFRGATNDLEPKNAAMVGQKLFKIMTAILESYSSNDHSLVDYIKISQSEEFRRYLNLVQELHRLNLCELAEEEKLALFLNLYNAMVIHALIRLGPPVGMIARRSFFTDFQYVLGGNSYSISSIRNDILRGPRRSAPPFIKPFIRNTKSELCLQKLNPIIHFGLCDGTKSSPVVRFFSPQGVEAELKRAAREFFQNHGIEVFLDKRTIHLSRIIKWYKEDFGEGKKMLKWIMSYIDANQKGLLTHLLGVEGGGSFNIVYQDYDWSVNSLN